MLVHLRTCQTLPQPRRGSNLTRRTRTSGCRRLRHGLSRGTQARSRTVVAFDGNARIARGAEASEPTTCVAELLRPRRSEEPRALACSNAPANPTLMSATRGLVGITSSTSVWFVAACASAAVATFIAARWFLSMIRRRFAAVKKRVVVIGGGFAGMQIVKDLSFACEVTLLDVRDYFEYTPGVLAAMVGGGPLRHGAGTSGRAAKLDRDGGGRKAPGPPSAAREDAMARIGRLQRSLRSVAPEKATVLRVASPNSFAVRCGTVDVSSGEGSAPDVIINWDYLVFATGSAYPAPIKPAVVPSSSDGDATPESTSVGRREYFADAAARAGRAAHVLVIGGGVVGVELAAELAMATGRAPQRVTLAHGASRLLDDLPRAASDHATRWLQRHGVHVLVGEKLVQTATTNQEEENAGRTSAKKPLKYVGERSGTVVTPDEVIVACGARPATDFLKKKNSPAESVPPLLNVPLDVGGGIQIDKDTLRVDCRIVGSTSSEAHTPQVFCVGDAASKPSERYLASFAHWEAEYVSHAILRDVDGETLTKKFEAPPRLMCVSLGPWDGIFVWDDRLVWTGVAAGLMKLFLELWFKNFLPAPYSVARFLPHMSSSSK